LELKYLNKWVVCADQLREAFQKKYQKQ